MWVIMRETDASHTSQTHPSKLLTFEHDPFIIRVKSDAVYNLFNQGGIYSLKLRSPPKPRQFEVIEHTPQRIHDNSLVTRLPFK